MITKPKKNGKKVSFYMDADIVDRLEAYCEDKGQSKTLAVERILKAHLDKYDEEKNASSDDKEV